MQSRAVRLGALGGLAAVAVILFLVLQGGGGSSDTTTGLQVIHIAGGAPVGGVKELTYTKGDQVQLRVYPEPDDVEVHVHGYEIEKKTGGSTKPVTVSFPADLEGGYEIEVHTRTDEFQIADLKVNP
jgi:hypothetical protein